MKIICDYCGSSVEDDQEKCPNCGGTLNVKPRVNGKPKTLEELKRYCQENGLTAERTRFFIGEDYRGARAFGIFQNGSGEFVVYKNKADGSRAVRDSAGSSLLGGYMRRIPFHILSRRMSV